MSNKYLIIGLGNIGAQYENTRHNIGFDVIACFAKEKNINFNLERLAFTAQTALKGKKVILIKPTTFMNLSGKALKYYADKENIPIENILVVTDDLALPLEKARMRTSGTHAGHNGLKNIEAVLGHNNYTRLRFGIGNAFKHGQQIDFVLGQWAKNEIPIKDQKVYNCSQAIEDFILLGATFAMNKINALKFV